MAEEKKGTSIRVLDVSETLKIADYFVLVTAQNRHHARAIYNEIHARLKASNRNARAEGLTMGWWVLMDYGDVVVHVLQREAREYYDLDSLYGSSSELDWRSVELAAPAQEPTPQEPAMGPLLG